MDNLEFQVLRDVVKEGGDDVMEKFEKKFKDIKVEGKRKSVPAVVYTVFLIIFLKLTIWNPSSRQCTWEQKDTTTLQI